MPFRINFFDDSIEEIKFFNTETQISQKSLAKNSLTIFPASEVVASDENRQKALDCLRQRRSKLSVASYQEALQHLESGIFFSGVEKYRCYFSDKQFSWLDLINKDWKIFLWQRDKIDLTLQNHTNEIQEDFQLENSKEPLPPAPEELYYKTEEIKKMLLDFSPKRVFLKIVIEPQRKRASIQTLNRANNRAGIVLKSRAIRQRHLYNQIISLRVKPFFLRYFIKPSLSIHRKAWQEILMRTYFLSSST